MRLDLSRATLSNKTTMHLSTLDSRAPASVLVPELSPDRPRPPLTDIAVVGLGYVGLPLSLQFARSGVNVLGLDIDPEKVDALNEGRSYIKHVPAETVAEEVKAKSTRGHDGFCPRRRGPSGHHLRADAAQQEP